MKFLAGLAVAASLASSAAAAAVASAPVYILSKSSYVAADSDAAPPSVPRQIARQILLRRLAIDAGGLFESLPRDYQADAAIDVINRFDGDAGDLLFEAANRQPEMLIVIEGVKDTHAAAIESALSASPAYTVADPPNQAANAKLFVDELARNGVAAHKDVALSEALVPQAWANGVFVGLYDVKRTPSAVDEIVKTLPAIVALANAGDAQVTVMLMPEGSRSSKTGNWAPNNGVVGTKKSKSAPALELRAEESVFVEDTSADYAFDSETTFVKAASDNTNNNNANNGYNGDNGAPLAFAAATAAAASGPIPACFQSFNSCVAQTNSCSGHGKCVDKYAVNNGGVAAAQKGGAAGSSCFVCHCVSTLNRPEDAPGGLSTTQWAGSTCSKIDVSVPFWLITGFSVAIVGAVAFAVGLLFSVGEEKLPGVIGAGVSRSK